MAIVCGASPLTVVWPSQLLLHLQERDKNVHLITHNMVNFQKKMAKKGQIWKKV